MAMSFHWSYDNETVLFDFWKITSAASLIGSCFIVIAIGVFHHILILLQTRLRDFYCSRLLQGIKDSHIDSFVRDDEPMLNSQGGVPSVRGFVIEEDGAIYMKYPTSGGKFYFAECVLQFIYYFYIYAEMLIFMTYQLHLCLALCLGLSFGYFGITGWMYRKIGHIKVTRTRAGEEKVEVNRAPSTAVDNNHCCD